MTNKRDDDKDKNIPNINLIQELLVPTSKYSIAREERPLQIEMANTIYAAMQAQKNVIIEAGVGTGKSFAYLIPSIASGGRTIISTATIGLQSQLINKDLPAIQAGCNKLGVSFSYAIAKGKSNYLCPLAAESAEKEGAVKLSKKIQQWASAVENGYASGDRASGPPIDDYKVWDAINAEKCISKSCRFADQCSSLKARKEAKEAQIVIANHAITAYHIASINETYCGFLGETENVIIDEAHKAASFFRAAMSRNASKNSVPRIKKRSLEISIPDLNTNAVFKWSSLANKFFDSLPTPNNAKPYIFINTETPSRNRIKSCAEELISCKEYYGPLYKYFNKIEAEVLENHNNDYFHLYQNLKSLRNAVDNIKFSATKVISLIDPPEEELSIPTDTNYVVYVTKNDKTNQKVLHDTPLHVGGTLKNNLYPNNNTVVFTSATLAVGNSYSSIIKEFGIDPCYTEQKILGSTFDYKNQAALYLPKSIKQPVYKTMEGYHADAAKEIIRLIKLTHGKTLVLFTSRTDMREISERVIPELPEDIEVFVQHEDVKADNVLKEYIQSHNNGSCGVIFGLKSFWEGVSLEGDRLTSVIVTKLPFPPMSDPIYAAKCAASSNPFIEVTLPEMIKDLKQGTGRLIRTDTDYGIISILDSRVHTKNYGTTIMKALPFEARTTKFETLKNWYRNKEKSA